MTAPQWGIRDRRAEGWAQALTWLLLAITSIATASIATQGARAEGTTQDFSIAAQPLDRALTDFADQAGLEILLPSDLVRGLKSQGLSGAATPVQGLAQLLHGTGLNYRFVDPHTVTIERSDPLAALVAEARRPIDYAQVSEPTPKKPKALPPKKNDTGPTELPEMTVTASPLDETSYTVPNASTATKTDTPIFDTPVSIQVVPRKLMDDQQVISLPDALRNVSGVQYNSSYQPYNDLGADRSGRRD